MKVVQPIKIISVIVLLLMFCVMAQPIYAMDITLQELKDSNAYKGADQLFQHRAETELTKTLWDKKSKNIGYAGATDITKQRIKDAFDALHPMGPQVRLEEENKYNTTLENVTDNLTESGKSVLGTGRKKELNYVSPCEQKAIDAFTNVANNWEEANGFFEKLEVAGYGLSRLIGQLIDNPAGVIEASSSSVPMIIIAMVLGFGLAFKIVLVIINSTKRIKAMKLKNWYSNINKKQRIIIWTVSVLLSATNPIGWVFLVWWLIPTLIYLEYCRE